MEDNRHEEGRDYEDPAVDLSLLGDPHAWRIVRLGLSMMFGGIVAGLGLVVICVFLLFAYAVADVSEGLITLTGYCVLGLSAGLYFITCVGRYLCCAVPPEAPVRGLIVGSVACLTLLVVSGAVWFVLAWMRWDEFPVLQRMNGQGRALFGILLGFLALGLFIAGHVAFVLFLRGVARHFRDPRLADRVDSYLAIYVVFSIVMFATAFLATVIEKAAALACIFGLFLGIAGHMLIFYLVLIGKTRDAIADALRRAG